MKRVRGLSMIELLIALAIGSFIIIGTVMVYSQSRTTYTINETQARLQENARYVLAIMEPDIQLAGNYGFSNNPNDVMWGPTQTFAADMEPSDTQVGPATACGTNFAVNVLMSVDGSNDSYTPYLPTSTCNVAAVAGSAVANTDVLTIRRASTEAVTATSTRIQIYANRLLKTQQQLFNSSANPGVIDNWHEIRNLLVRSYYVGANSSARNNFPTLWRKSLGVSGGAPGFEDEEIMPGVEDFQIQFGIDTGDRNADSIPDTDVLEPFGVPDTLNGVVSRWVAPGDALTKSVAAGGINAQIVAVRVWLRIRADQPETGYNDDRVYNYAGRPNWSPSTDGVQGFRRILVSRTFFVRNARVF